MKKILFLLIAFTIAVSASADVGNWRDYRPTKKQATTQSFQDRFKLYAEAHKAKTVASQLRDGAPEVIYDQPEGELVEYTKTCNAFFYNPNGLQQITGFERTPIVYAPDNVTVYIQNPVAAIPANTWVRGTVNGNKITVPLGQYIIYDNEENTGYYLSWGTNTVNPDETCTFTPDPTVTEATFTIDGDCLIMDNTSGGADGDGATGLTILVDQAPEVFAMEYNSVYTPYVEPTVIDEQPEGELVTYQRNGYTTYNGTIDEQLGSVDIVYASDGETVYIKDIMFGSNLGTWVRGTISGSKLHVPLGQYIYCGNGYNFFIGWGQSYWSSNYGQWLLNYYSAVTEATFTIDGNTISLDNSSFGPDTSPDGATGLTVVVDVQPDALIQCDVLTRFVIPTVINEQPEGNLVTYLRNNMYVHYNEQYIENIDDGVYRVVYAPDGETVYIQDPIYYVDEGTWVKGTLVNGKIHVPLGQYVYWNENEGYGLVLSWGSNEGSYTFTPDPSATEVTYTIDGSYLVMDNSTPGNNGDGATGLAVSWTDYGILVMECALPIPVEMITEQPEGTYKKYFRSIHTSGFKYREKYYENGIAEMVYSNTGDVVYIKGIINGANSAWVKGTIQGNKIHVPLGQCVDRYQDYYAKLRWVFETVENGYATPHPNYNVSEATFTINGDKITLDENNHFSDPQDEHRGLGICWYNSNGSLTDVWPVKLKVQFMPYFEPTVLTDRPEGELKTFIRRGNAIEHMSEMYKGVNLELPMMWPHQMVRQEGYAYVVYAPDGRTVYLHEPVQCYTNVHEPYYAWVAGTLSEDGHKIIVPLDQYVSWDPLTNTALRLGWGTSRCRTDHEGDEETYVVPDNSVMTVTYTINDNCISMDNSSGTYVQEIDPEFTSIPDLFAGNKGLTITDQFGHWNGEMNWGTKLAGDHPAVPMDPVIVEWYDSGNEDGGSALAFNIEATDVDGYGLEETGYSYTIYTDKGKVYTFEASDYGLEEDVTEVTFVNWQDNYKLRPGCIYFYRTNAEGYEPFFDWRIGIQLHYTCDGVKQSSNIVYLEVFDEPGGPENPGDVTGDGIINVADVTSLIDYLLGSSTGSFNEANADVNGNGIVNVEDVTALIDLLLSNS